MVGEDEEDVLWQSSHLRAENYRKGRTQYGDPFHWVDDTCSRISIREKSADVKENEKEA